MDILITGVTGQCGSYLAEQLLEKGHKIYGMFRRVATPNFWRIQHLLNDIELVEGDLCDTAGIFNLIGTIKPDRLYNLAAQSFVAHSFNNPIVTNDINAIGVFRILEAIKQRSPHTRYLNMATSEMFGKVQETPQIERTPFYPRSPYGISKLSSYWATINYRESYDIFAANMIMYNSESPRRGEEFVTRKITKAISNIIRGKQNKLYLGNIKTKRDWSFAGDTMRAAEMIMEQMKPDNFIVCSGETHSIKEFLELAFRHVGLEWKDYVVIDSKFFRPAEVDILLGDYSKIKKLGWEPFVKFEKLVRMMVDSDLEEKC